MIKQVSDFIPESIDVNSEILFVGISPSSNTSPFKNGTFDRLKKWADTVGLEKFDFCNVIPDVVNGMDMTLVDFDSLILRCEGKKKIVALGGFVARVLLSSNITHMKIDHPSPRNRNLNSVEYEEEMIVRLKEYLDVH